jgi:hypothetical protein
MKTILLLLTLIAPLQAKEDLVKITIQGSGIATPIEITTPEIGLFNIWAGPGVTANKVEQTEGFIIDWKKGKLAEKPAASQVYEVTFYGGRPPTKPSIIYKVRYDSEGNVYLPGKNDEEFKFNQAMWHGHNLEGNWFPATTEWKNFVKLLLK